MIRLLPILLLLCAANASGPPEKVFPFDFTQEDLPNGLRLVTIPTGFPNIVSLYIVVHTGSRNEAEPGKSGYAHLFEHITVYHTTFSKEDLDTMLMLEADRFQNLKYSPEAFKTETLAVLGEYNKNSANPSEKLAETLRDTAFQLHTYKHGAMGFLKDIQDMPNQYDYGIEFFQRYYRPEYTTMIVAGALAASDAPPAAVAYLWE